MVPMWVLGPFPKSCHYFVSCYGGSFLHHILSYFISSNLCLTLRHLCCKHSKRDKDLAKEILFQVLESKESLIKDKKDS